MPEHTNDYRVRWQNYRVFQDTGEFAIRPLTVLIGANNSGKTSALSPLLLLCQTLTSRDNETPLVTRGALLDAGLFRNIIYNQDSSRDVRLRFDFHVHATEKSVKPVGAYPPGGIEIVLGYDRKKAGDVVKLKRMSIFDLFGQKFLDAVPEKDSDSFDLEDFPAKSKFKAEELRAITKSKPVNFLLSPTITLSNYYGRDVEQIRKSNKKFSDQFELFLQIIAFVFEEVRTIFSRMVYIGPLRDRLQRHYEIASEKQIAVGSHGENTANIIRQRYDQLGKNLSKWVRRFEFGDSIRISETFADQFSLSFVRNSPRRLITNIADAGFGASQVLPLVVQALAAPRRSLTIAEQPEIHLNPRLQTELADLFVEMANANRRVIVETHSEHLLLRLRRLVADNTISQDKVAIYYVERGIGGSTIRELPLKKNGHFASEDWPKGFFEEPLREALALATAQAIPKNRRGTKNVRRRSS